MHQRAVESDGDILGLELSDNPTAWLGISGSAWGNLRIVSVTLWKANLQVTRRQSLHDLAYGRKLFEAILGERNEEALQATWICMICDRNAIHSSQKLSLSLVQVAQLTLSVRKSTVSSLVGGFLRVFFLYPTFPTWAGRLAPQHNLGLDSYWRCYMTGAEWWFTWSDRPTSTIQSCPNDPEVAKWRSNAS